MNLAQEAYEAYCNHTGWKSLATGADLPQWDALPENIKQAWKISAAWVAGKVTGNHDWKESAIKRAAPDLLEACKEALQFIAAIYGDRATVLKDLQSAIAKATHDGGGG